MVQKSASSDPTRAWRPRTPVISHWPSAIVRLSYTAHHPLTKTWLLPAHCSPTFYYSSVPSAPSREKRTKSLTSFLKEEWEERVFITKTTELNSFSQRHASLLTNIFLPPIQLYAPLPKTFFFCFLFLLLNYWAFLKIKKYKTYSQLCSLINCRRNAC